MAALISPSVVASTSRSRLFCTCSAALAVSRASSRKTPSSTGPPKRSSSKKPKVLAPHLPQTELFKACVGLTPISHRPSLINQDTARDLVRAWGVDKMHDVTVMEVYPGAGGLTRAFLELPNVKKVVCIEESLRYRPLLDAAKEQQADPERLAILQHDAFLWEAYSKVEDEGHLKDVPVRPFEELHDKFFLAAQLPNTRHGEQLFVQFLSTSAGRMWLWKYGRFEMGFLGSDTFFSKIRAPPGTTAHHKLSVLMPALAAIETVSLMSGFSPAEQHFHKPRGDPALVSAVKVTPHPKPLVDDFESLEYVARNMFVAKSQPWQKAIAALAAGATNLYPEMMSRGMPSGRASVNDLTLDHWRIIADVYNAWPFKQDIMFDDGQFTMDA